MSLSLSSIAGRRPQAATGPSREAGQSADNRFAMTLVAVLLLGCAAVLAFLPIDRVVSSSAGKIVSIEPVTVLQALDPSIIKTIDVKEGDAVQAGQQLATLDATFATADVGQLRQQVAGLTAQIARAQAERNKQPFAPTISPNDVEASYLALQKGLFDQRAAEFSAQLRSFDAKIQQQQATIVKLQTDEALYKEREQISQKIETMRDTLFKSGSSSLLNLLTATDQRLEMQRTMEFGHNSLVEAQHTIASLKADREAYIQKWFGDVSQEIVTAQNSLDTAAASLEKASKHQDLVHLTASEPGVVLTLAPLSVGSVLKEGDTLMSIMPLRSGVEADVSIASKDIGFVQAGNEVRLKVDAFNASDHGSAMGTVKWISEGAFTSDENGKEVDPYYKARVSIDRYNFTGVPPTFRLIPGMTMSADINVGQRSLARYVIGYLMRGVGESMREP
jgi:hemolysin D